MEDRDLGPEVHPASFDPVDVRLQSDETVPAASSQIGLDQPSRGDHGVLSEHAGGFEDRRGEGLELLGSVP